MKFKYLFLGFIALTCLVAGCSGSSNNDFTDLDYDVNATATLSQVMQDISALSGVNFTIDPELQKKLSEEPVDLPTLLGLKVGQVLTLIQDTMPEMTSYIYQQQNDGSILLRLRFQQSENLSGAVPLTVLEFEAPGVSLATLVSDPLFEEECGGPDDILGLLGDGGDFDILVEVQSDPGGHAPFIGEFPPSIHLAISGNDLLMTGNSPWVELAGDIQNDGSFTCSGTGLVAGIPNVLVVFEGQASIDGPSGVLTMGAGGELPGGEAAVFAVSSD